MAASTSVSTSLKEYLKRYETKSEDEKTKKKKKKKTKTRTDSMGILVVDEDPVWQKPVNLDEENEDESADEEKPQVDEDIEVKRMKRLEQLRSRRPYHSISEDGSGWVSISETPKESDFNKENDDMFPPRQRRARYDTPSPEPELKTADSGNENPDVSPPRQRRRHYYTPSPERENPDRNLSPPLRSRTDASSEFEKKNSQWSSDKNVSKISLVEDLSPPRKSRKGSERSKSPDLFPPRRIRRHSPEVASNVSQVADLSPPRKSRRGSERSKSPDLSPPRRIRRQSPEVDGVSLVADLSPPRKSRKDSFLKEGQKAGLISRQDIREQTAKIREDSARLKDLDPSVSGRGAEPVYRDKVKGERISKEEFLKSQKGEEKPKEKKLEWGKGLAQKREAEAREHELEIEKDKPFARTRDDPELDKMLKERVRWGDPMAHLVKRKQFEPVLEDLGDNEKMKESGFIIPQEIPSHSWIKRGMDAAPNRYGIRPGRHWDGVDRSTGYEKEYFKRMNEKHATEREAYLWSVSDM